MSILTSAQTAIIIILGTFALVSSFIAVIYLTANFAKFLEKNFA